MVSYPSLEEIEERAKELISNFPTQEIHSEVGLLYSLIPRRNYQFVEE